MEEKENQIQNQNILNKTCNEIKDCYDCPLNFQLRCSYNIPLKEDIKNKIKILQGILKKYNYGE